MKPQVEIDVDSGFCFGVVTAIRKAEEELDKSGTLYCLGDIVHNAKEVERLRLKGLVTITHQELEKLHDVKVLLRAHGEPPSTYELARRNNIEIIDATCPVVLQLQRRIKKDYDAAKEENTSPTILIYGKHGHAEVNGLVGQTNGEAIVIPDLESLKGVDLSRDILLYSQTTKSVEGFEDVVRWINGHKKEGSFRFFDTICRQVSGRMDKIHDFASRHDVVIFVSGAKSSNGKVLFAECKKINPSSYLIGDETEFCDEWIEGARSIGVCGATSTPAWLMKRVADHIRSVVSR